MKDLELTLLSEGQIWGNGSENQLEVLRKYGTKAAISDLCFLTGSDFAPIDYNVEDTSLGKAKRRTWMFWTKTNNRCGYVYAVDKLGNMDFVPKYLCSVAVRPVLQSSWVYSQISPNIAKGYNDTYEVEYGEYPQYAASSNMQRILELELNRGLNKTGRNYTFESTIDGDYDTGFRKVTYTYNEYEYQERKFIRIKANSYLHDKFKISNGVQYKNGEFVWIEVSPVRWLVDEETKTLISKIGLVSGVRFLEETIEYKGDFENTEMYTFLNSHMIKDLFQSLVPTKLQRMSLEEKTQLLLQLRERASTFDGFKKNPSTNSGKSLVLRKM